MSCDSLEAGIVELARGGALGSGTAAAIETHLEHCALCNARLTRERELSRGLRALAMSTNGAGPGDAIERRLLEAFAEVQAARKHSKAARFSWMRVAAAAVVLAAGAFTWIVSSRPPRDDGATASTPEAPRAAPSQERSAPVASAPAAGTVVNPAAVPQRPRVHARPQAPRAAQRIGLAEGFVALPEAAGLPDFESGEIVRIEIPLTLLPTYGLQIPVAARGAPVEADFLVGQDGQPRAIRLVRSTEGGSNNLER